MVMAWLYHRTYNAAIMSSCKQPIANISHFHCMFTMFNKTVKIVIIFGFLLCGHCVPSNGDVLSFQALLANYTSQKHLGTSPNLTNAEEMQRSPATWPSHTESEAFLPYTTYTKFLGTMPKTYITCLIICIGVFLKLSFTPSK